jgi:hypothetical protein
VIAFTIALIIRSSFYKGREKGYFWGRRGRGDEQNGLIEIEAEIVG